MNTINWWGIMFFVAPIVLAIGTTIGITVIEALKGLWRLIK